MIQVSRSFFWAACFRERFTFSSSRCMLRICLSSWLPSFRILCVHSCTYGCGETDVENENQNNWNMTSFYCQVALLTRKMLTTSEWRFTCSLGSLLGVLPNKPISHFYSGTLIIIILFKLFSLTLLVSHFCSECGSILPMFIFHFKQSGKACSGCVCSFNIFGNAILQIHI